MAALVKLLIALVAIGAALLVVLALVAVARRGRLPPVPYQRAKALFSPAELKLLAALEVALGSSYRIFGKVRVGDLAEVKPGLAPQARQAALNRVAYKHFDFLVCATDSCEPLCAVELNDSSHAAGRAKKRDAFVAGVCEAIALPLVTFRAGSSYDPAEIRDHLRRALTPRELQNTGQ